MLEGYFHALILFVLKNVFKVFSYLTLLQFPFYLNPVVRWVRTIRILPGFKVRVIEHRLLWQLGFHKFEKEIQKFNYPP